MNRVKVHEARRKRDRALDEWHGMGDYAAGGICAPPRPTAVVWDLLMRAAAALKAAESEKETA